MNLGIKLNAKDSQKRSRRVLINPLPQPPLPSTNKSKFPLCVIIDDGADRRWMIYQREVLMTGAQFVFHGSDQLSETSGK